MSGEELIAQLLHELSASQVLAREGYSAFPTPAGAVVVQKDKVFKGVWSATDRGLTWTPAAGPRRGLIVATAEAAVAHTIEALGLGPKD
jgi:hypothetical protein